MSDKTSKTLILAVVIILAAVGILGYSTQEKPHEEPFRILYKTKGGPVVFDHKAHSGPDGFTPDCEGCHHLRKRLVHRAARGAVTFDHHTHSTSPAYGLKCGECHHEQALAMDSRIRKCGACHAPGSKDNAEFESKGRIHGTAMGVKCVECHQMHLTFKTDEGPVVFDHHAHSTSDDYDLGCDECHHKYDSDKTPAAELQKCGVCHREGAKANASFAEAEVHTTAIGANCAECHEEQIEEESCEFCHRDTDEEAPKAGKAEPTHGRSYGSCDFCHKPGEPDRNLDDVEHCDECHGMAEGHNPNAGSDDPLYGECSGFTISERKPKEPHPGVGAKCVQCHEKWFIEKTCDACHLSN